MIGGVLSELGKKLGEKWLTRLVLPGALYLAIVICAWTLGQTHALDVHRMVDRITGWAKSPTTTSAGGQVVLLTAALGGSAALGLAAQALGALIERTILISDWRALPRWLQTRIDARVSTRHRRWAEADKQYRSARELAAQALARGEPADPTPRHTAFRAMRAISIEPPERPTWPGDRMNAVAVRLERDLHIAFSQLWPVLWLHLPEDVRAQIRAARTALSQATGLAAWTILYAALAMFWWPAAPIAVTMAVAARQRVRATTEAYAELLEASVRLHARSLLNVLDPGATEPIVGDALTPLLGT